MLAHSVDYLELFCIAVYAWCWLELAAAAREALAEDPADRGFYEAKLCAAEYHFATELPRVHQLAALCRSGDTSYTRLDPDWL